MSTPSVWALVIGMSLQGGLASPWSSGHIRRGSTQLNWRSQAQVGTMTQHATIQLRQGVWRMDYRHGFAGRALYFGQQHGSKQWYLAHTPAGNSYLHWSDASDSPGLKRIRWSTEHQIPTDILWQYSHGEFGWHAQSGYYANAIVGDNRWSVGKRHDGFIFGAWQHRRTKLRLGGIRKWQESQMQVALGRMSLTFHEMHHVRHGLNIFTSIRYHNDRWQAHYQWQHHRHHVHRFSLTIPWQRHRFAIYTSNLMRDQLVSWHLNGEQQSIRVQLSPEYLLAQWGQNAWQFGLRWHHQRALSEGFHIQVQHRWSGKTQAKISPISAPIIQASPRLWILTSGTIDHPPLPIDLIDEDHRVHHCVVLATGKQLKTHVPPGKYHIQRGAHWPSSWNLQQVDSAIVLQSGMDHRWMIFIQKRQVEPRWVNPNESSE